MHAADVVPLVGASAGVSAATGAAARFVFSSGTRLGAMGQDAVVRALPALTLTGMLGNRQTMIFVIVWFVSNWLFGAGVVPLGDAEQSIAWEAHIGGFLAGLLLFPLLDRHGRRALEPT
jgi:membrane associated rhomboid family serine protease